MPCRDTLRKIEAAAPIDPLSLWVPTEFSRRRHLPVGQSVTPGYPGPLGVGQGTRVHRAMSPPEAGAGRMALRSSRVSSLPLTCSVGTAQHVHPQLRVHVWHPA